MREWLSGRASPCQGERREFESRLPLHVKPQEHILGLVFLFIFTLMVVFMNIKLKKNKVNFKVFNSFLMSLGIILFFLSFSFDNFLNTLFCIFALLCVMFPRYKGIVLDFKAKKYFNLDFMCMAAFVYLLISGKNSNALWCALLYSFVASAMDTVFNSESEIAELFNEIKDKKYHKIIDRNSEIANSLDIYYGDFVELFSGEVMPVDGVIKAGTGTMSAVNISGDNKAIIVSKGMEVMAGYTLLNGHIIVEASSSVLNSSLAKTVEKTNGASLAKTPYEKYSVILFNVLAFISIVAFWIMCVVKFVKDISNWEYFIYTVPIVFIFSSFSGLQGILSDGYKVAVLRSAQKGIVISKNKFLENTLFIKNIAFFTRGVITDKYPSVRAVYPTDKTTKDELLLFTAYSQCKVNQGVLSACVKELGKKIDKRQIKNHMMIDDHTAIIQMQGIEVLSGPSDALLRVGIKSNVPNDVNKVCVAINGEFIGYVEFDYAVKDGAKQALDTLRLLGIKKTAVLSFESQKTADTAAISCGIAAATGDLSKSEIKENVDKLGKKWLVLSDGVEPELLTSSHVISYDNDTEQGFDAYFTSMELTAAAQYIGILNETKALIVINFLFEIILKSILLVMILNGSNAVWLAVLMSLAFKLLRKMNNYRLLNKI